MAYKQKSPINVSSGATGVQSNTAYGVLCGGTTATGAIQSISAGSSGQFLKSNGASNLPAFDTGPSKGCWTLLHTASCASVNNVVFNNTYITTTYSSFRVSFDNVYGVEGIHMQFSTDNGSTYLSTNYISGAQFMAYSTATVNNYNSTTKCILFNNAASGYPVEGNIILNGLAVSGNPTYQATYWAGSWMFVGGGIQTATVTVNAIKFYSSSGSNWTTGTISIYGIMQ